MEWTDSDFADERGLDNVSQRKAHVVERSDASTIMLWGTGCRLRAWSYHCSLQELRIGVAGVLIFHELP